MSESTNLVENQPASTRATIPAGWTNKLSTRAKSQIEDMLRESTGVSGATLDLAETAGNQYLFFSGATYYFWNVATESGVKVLSPVGQAALYAQMTSDIRKVDAQRLPYVAP